VCKRYTSDTDDGSHWFATCKRASAMRISRSVTTGFSAPPPVLATIATFGLWLISMSAVADFYVASCVLSLLIAVTVLLFFRCSFSASTPLPSHPLRHPASDPGPGSLVALVASLGARLSAFVVTRASVAVPLYGSGKVHGNVDIYIEREICLVDVVTCG
jgi:hypothetical protein